MKKFDSYEDALAAQDEQKAKVKEAKANLATFCKENKIKKNDDPEEKLETTKLKKEFAKLEKAVETTSATMVKINEAVKELKPATRRVTKYEYPEGLTDLEKKKYRAKLRREAAGEEEGGEKKAKKKVSKKEKPAKKSTEGKAPAKKKLVGKKKKAAPAAEEQEED